MKEMKRIWKHDCMGNLDFVTQKEKSFARLMEISQSKVTHWRVPRTHRKGPF